MKNRKEKAAWMQTQLDAGYTEFEYIKGIVNGKRINVAIINKETQERFDFIWE